MEVLLHRNKEIVLEEAEQKKIDCVDTSHPHQSIDECHQAKSRGWLRVPMKHGVKDKF